MADQKSNIKLKTSGLMSDIDIINAIKNHEMLITPFDVNNKDDNRLTPSGFNFSFSRFIVSINKRVFCQLYEENNELYFNLDPGDTAIALTNESIWVSKSIGGTFHSKVSYVSQGLGHISTTLDPGWQGQLLISINNPTKKKIKIVIGKCHNNKIIYNHFITLYLFRVITDAERISDNNTSRLDTLLKILQGAPKNKQQNELINILTQMHSFILQHKSPIPEGCKLINDKQYDAFIKNHTKIMNEWDTKYKDIAKINRKVINHNRWVLALRFLLVLLIFSILILAVLFINENENVRWLIELLVVLFAIPAYQHLLKLLNDFK